MSTEQSRDAIVIFTDGACTGNPGPGGWASIVATTDGKVRELGGGDRDTTNNRMEMLAAINGLSYLPVQAGTPIIVCTDSTYLIRGITQWVRSWKARGWRTADGKDVANRDLWEALEKELQRLHPSKVSWRYVPGHSGVDGNERCDQIAVAFSLNKPINLYDGPASQYTVSLIPPPEDETTMQRPSNSSSSVRKPGGYNNSGGSSVTTYLSYHSGVVMRHRTWSGCERRVKGQSNAKFKKAKSAQEEYEILKGWGLDPQTVVIEE